jgi:ribulose 1,5-bisphosphate synthetase/thiazole synthase
MNTLAETAPKVPVAGNYDVIVCGGGPAGFVAAIAARRAGATTLLVERYGFLGGTATAGLMVEFGSIYDGARVIVGGITHEFLHRMDDFGGAPMRHPDSHRMVFDPESMIAVCQDMLTETGADVLLHTLVVDAIGQNGLVKGVIVESKSGRQALLGKTVIDATGDGDVAVRAGAEYHLGRKEDGRMQPVSLEVIVGNVDSTRLSRQETKTLTEMIRREKEAGEWTIPTDRLFSMGRVLRRGAPDRPKEASFFINGTNVLDVDGTDARDLTRAEFESRKQVDVLVRFLRRHAPGFENCYLERTAAQVGIRETRRIKGDYTLSGEEALAGNHFADGVVPSHQSIDVHDVAGKCFEHKYLELGTHYEIPYRCFLPAGLDGILVSGRCISVDHEALGSVRRMVTCMPMGEACGRAAAMASGTGCSLRDVPVGLLRQALREGGTVIGDEKQ